jgi:hypothetical protein
MNRKDSERQESLESLRALLKPGDTVFTKLDHVSRSGMSRKITPLIIVDGEPRYLGYHVGRILQHKTDDHSVSMQGYGMDMGFELVYVLGRYLFPDGFKVEGRGRNGDTSGWDKDGGYALHQRWL